MSKNRAIIVRDEREYWVLARDEKAETKTERSEYWGELILPEANIGANILLNTAF